ncbi:LysR family transcriptional regulator [Pseudonocardia eucalypti]|uniref:LysR family transcriptional regulator n=1 Tax=Pseudonocardia eucalypti TaxID=648755 RepID=A0ABP9PVM7_9PSEU|nr:DNA-binding transcriptional LysR family regulator [Pseudonocardia eucalypti]
MDDRKLRYFVAVAEELNFTRASQRLYATQSTVSATIRALEQELGASLLARTTRSVSLTEAGATFLPEARAAIEAIDRARASVEPMSAGLRGSLAVGTLSSLTTVNVPELAGDFHRRYPSVKCRIEISPRGAAGHVERIKSGFLDLAIVGDAEGDPELDVRPIRSFRLAVFVAGSHPLARRRNVDLATLAGEPFVDLPIGFAQREVVDRAFAGHGLRREIAVEVMDLAAIPLYVAHGMGVALLPDGFAADTDLPVRALPLAGVELNWTLSVISAHGRRLSRAAHAFLDLVPEHTTPDASW